MSVVPGVPETQRSGRSFGKHSGRKLLESSSGKAAKPSDEKSERARAKKITNMEEIDRILENDALDLLNMKKEVGQVQEVEVNKSQRVLGDIQKEHDALHMANNLKEKYLMKTLVNIKSLEAVGAASAETSENARAKKQSLFDSCDEVNDLLASELRTGKMQQHMIKRLNNEIVECKTESFTLNFNGDHIKHELASIENTIRLTRQELLEQEKALDVLSQSVKSRKEQREDKLAMLSGIVAEGESSVRKVQKATLNLNYLRQSSNRMNRSREIQSPKGQFRLPDCLSFLEDPDNTLTARQIRELLERYESRDVRLSKMHQQETELIAALAAAKERKLLLSEQLKQMGERHAQLASNRQIYQEVDMKDAALASARKQCEECKEREQRLRASIEALSRAFPRFLTKITKVVHPIPSADQLPDAVHKLEDEISKLIKTIDTAMLKEATADDLAVINNIQSGAHAQPTGAGAGGNNPNAAANGGVGGGAAGTGGAGDAVRSEIDRLQKLPGYYRLQRQLYYNLMTAKPDISDKNVRIKLNTTGKLTHKSNHHNRRSAGGSNEQQGNQYNNNNYYTEYDTGASSAANANGFYDHNGTNDHNPNGNLNNNNNSNNNNPSGSNSNNNNSSNNNSNSSSNEPIDRATIKNISSLIIEKDRIKTLKEQERQKLKLLY